MPKNGVRYAHLGSNTILMVRDTINDVFYAPFYVHGFQLVQPHALVETERFNVRFANPAQIDNTPDKLRWYRYQKGLLQRSVAVFAGIDRSTYSSYEEIGRDTPIERMKKIAELFGVPAEALLDE